MVVFPRVLRSEDFAVLLAQLRAQRLLAQQSGLVRVRRAERAIGHLLTLARRPDGIFEDDLLRWENAIAAAADEPTLTATAFVLLGEIGSQTAQRALLTVVGQTFRPAPQRRAALNAWRQAVADHGVMVTAEELARLTASARGDDRPDGITAELMELIDGGTIATSAAMTPRILRAAGPR